MELHATVSDLFKTKMSEMMGELPTEDSLPVEDSTDSSGSLPKSLSSWISNPNSITDALELEKLTTTGAAFNFYPLEAEQQQQGKPVWDYEPEEGERQIINQDRIEEPANQQLNAEITEEQQLNAEITEEQENDQQRREDMV
uniref:Uncharacterized protein n=1 Tax=Solanum tuberosum TaxID=4113 RepID=M1DJ72_SOLTU